MQSGHIESDPGMSEGRSMPGLLKNHANPAQTIHLAPGVQFFALSIGTIFVFFARLDSDCDRYRLAGDILSPDYEV